MTHRIFADGHKNNILKIIALLPLKQRGSPDESFKDKIRIVCFTNCNKFIFNVPAYQIFNPDVKFDLNPSSNPWKKNLTKVSF